MSLPDRLLGYLIPYKNKLELPSIS